MVEFFGGVEGPSDIGALRAIANHLGVSVSTIFGQNGKSHLLKNLPKWNRGADYAPWMVVVDLDVTFDCPGLAAQEWLPTRGAFMSFTIAVREMEAWLLGDPDRVSRFLGVAASTIPTRPEELADPKQALINIARRSRRREVREGLVPREGSGRAVGPTYVSDLSEFAESSWRPGVAADSCPSLARFLTRTAEVIERVHSA